MGVTTSESVDAVVEDVGAPRAKSTKILADATTSLLNGIDTGSLGYSEDAIQAIRSTLASFP